MPSERHQVSRVAVIRRNGFGDLLCCVPLLRLCRKVFPSAELKLFASARNQALLPYLKHYSPALYDHLHTLPSEGNKYFYLAKTAIQERSTHLDVVICAKANPMKLMNLFLWGLGARRRIAYTNRAWYSSRLFVNDGLRYKEDEVDNLHECERAMRLLDRDQNCPAKDYYPTLVIPESVQMKHEQTLAENLKADQAPGEKLRVLISLANTRVSDRTLAEMYRSVLNLAYESRPFEIVISAMRENEAAANQLRSQLKMPVSVVQGDFDAMMVLLSMMDAVYVAEGGIMHIAAAMNIPLLALFGKTKLARWRPMNPDAICLRNAKGVAEIPAKKMTCSLLGLLSKIEPP